MTVFVLQTDSSSWAEISEAQVDSNTEYLRDILGLKLILEIRVEEIPPLPRNAVYVCKFYVRRDAPSIRRFQIRN